MGFIVVWRVVGGISNELDDTGPSLDLSEYFGHLTKTPSCTSTAAAASAAARVSAGTTLATWMKGWPLHGNWFILDPLFYLILKTLTDIL